MSTTSTLELYIVAQGEANRASEDEIARCDGIESIPVLADSAEHALELAGAYDRGEVAIDNVTYNGRTIGAVSA